MRVGATWLGRRPTAQPKLSLEKRELSFFGALQAQGSPEIDKNRTFVQLLSRDVRGLETVTVRAFQVAIPSRKI
jgi:hypothetical protein